MENLLYFCCRYLQLSEFFNLNERVNRMKRKIVIFCACAFLLTLYSCDSLMNSNGGGVAAPNSPTMRSGSKHSILSTINKGKGDLKAVPRFHTNIQTKGTLTPGEPIQLVVNVRANLPTQNAKVRLFLPGIHALKHRKAGNPQLYRPNLWRHKTPGTGRYRRDRFSP